MANGRSLRGPYRGFHIGWPGSGKTGALVSLLNAGFKVRVLDFTGNWSPLAQYADDRALDNLDVVTLQDKLAANDAKAVLPLGVPTAFNQAAQLMKEWKYKDENGNEVNLGSSKEWGPDTVVVIDELTTLGKMAKNRAMVMNNKTPSTMTSAVWGAAVNDVTNLIGIMKEDKNRFHLIINAHKQVLGPADFVNQNDQKDEMKPILEAKLDMVTEGMIPPRIYPVGVTKNSSTTIHGELPIMLEFEKVNKAGKVQRVINTVGGPEIDIKIPGKGLKSSYSIETGLLEIFEALGYKAPGFGK